MNTTTLNEAKTMLVRRWGEMGGYWGINRTMAEIHALLFVTREPLCTDDIMASLHISRGNASMNLRGLVDWGLIRRVHKLGDRKEYFEADTDVWHMFETIMRERRRREVEPIIDTIDRCADMVSGEAQDQENGRPLGDPDDIKEFHDRVTDLRDFLSTMGTLFELVLHFGKDNIRDLTAVLSSQAEQAPANGSKRGKSRNLATADRN